MSRSDLTASTRTAVAQLLESYKRSGVKSLKLPEPMPSPKQAELSESTPPSESHLSITKELPAMNASTLESCAQQVAQCKRCQELAQFRTQTVFGVGDPNAEIMFIGEAPGADEDKQGEPFVGRAGQLLNKIITACKMQREQVYICNILKCRPPGNRNPSDEEAANCREFLDAQIEQVQPNYIVCWGSIAARNLLNSTETIGRMRGRFHDYRGSKVLCTYHPSYLLRNPSAKKEVWIDMKFLFADMDITLEDKQSN